MSLPHEVLNTPVSITNINNWVDALNLLNSQALNNGSSLAVAARQTTSGARYRTHPDNDQAANKVALLGFDELIMNSGLRYAGPLSAPLIADITTTGANALDTGSRTASAWYEIHAIGKGTGVTSDLALLLHRAKTWTPDALFSTTPDALQNLRDATGTANDLVAQGVQFTNSGPLVRASVGVLLNNTGLTGNVWLELRSDSAGNPNVVLAASDKMDAHPIAGNATASGQLLSFAFRTPYSVVASTQYHLVLNGDYTRSDTVNITWRGKAAGGYSGGSLKKYNGTAWSAAATAADGIFATYVETNNVALTMPATYSESCLLGYVYNSSGNALVPIDGFDRRQNFRASQAITGAIGASAAVLTDLQAFVPAITARASISFVDAGSACTPTCAPLPDGYGAVVTGAPGAYGLRKTTTQGIGAVDTVDEIPIELQGVYLVTNGGSTTFYLTGFTR